MSRAHGKNTVIVIDGHDLSIYCNTSSSEQSVGTEDVTCYGAGDDASDYTLGSASFSMGGFYDDTNSGPKAVLETIQDNRVAVPLIRRPEGTGAGLPQELFSVLVEKYVETAPVAGHITWSADCKRTGSTTRTTQ